MIDPELARLARTAGTWQNVVSRLVKAVEEQHVPPLDLQELALSAPVAIEGWQLGWDIPTIAQLVRLAYLVDDTFVVRLTQAESTRDLYVARPRAIGLSSMAEAVAQLQVALIRTLGDRQAAMLTPDELRGLAAGRQTTVAFDLFGGPAARSSPAVVQAIAAVESPRGSAVPPRQPTRPTTSHKRGHRQG